jgi:hypothetical protein
LFTRGRIRPSNEEKKPEKSEPCGYDIRDLIFTGFIEGEASELGGYPISLPCLYPLPTQRIRLFACIREFEARPKRMTATLPDVERPCPRGDRRFSSYDPRGWQGKPLKAITAPGDQISAGQEIFDKGFEPESFSPMSRTGAVMKWYKAYCTYAGYRAYRGQKEMCSAGTSFPAAKNHMAGRSQECVLKRCLHTERRKGKG